MLKVGCGEVQWARPRGDLIPSEGGAGENIVGESTLATSSTWVGDGTWKSDDEEDTESSSGSSKASHESEGSRPRSNSARVGVEQVGGAADDGTSCIICNKGE
jgi:hypothetical protein